MTDWTDPPSARMKDRRITTTSGKRKLRSGGRCARSGSRRTRHGLNKHNADRTQIGPQVCRKVMNALGGATEGGRQGDQASPRMANVPFFMRERFR